MKKLNSRDFKKENHFVLYDKYLNDEILLYIDNYEELMRYINIPAYNLVCRFNKSTDDCINVFIDRRRYILYTFIDEESEVFI